MAVWGKTYADSHYDNVYDFDKHTLDYKYDRTGFEHLTNEEFKGLLNRKINENWFEKYMQDWCKIIDSNQYDVVTGWLQDDTIDYLLNKGYQMELVLVDDTGENEEIYKERSINRGNNINYWNNLSHYYKKTMLKFNEKFKNNPNVKLIKLVTPLYLSDYLVLTGTNLYKKSNHIELEYVYNYVELIKQRIQKELPLEEYYLIAYAQLILTMLKFNHHASNPILITNEMVHDCWSVANNSVNLEFKNKPSLIPFNRLTKEIQDLDTPYTVILNDILGNLLKELEYNKLSIY